MPLETHRFECPWCLAESKPSLLQSSLLTCSPLVPTTTTTLAGRRGLRERALTTTGQSCSPCEEWDTLRDKRDSIPARTVTSFTCLLTCLIRQYAYSLLGTQASGSFLSRIYRLSAVYLLETGQSCTVYFFILSVGEVQHSALTTTFPHGSHQPTSC